MQEQIQQPGNKQSCRLLPNLSDASFSRVPPASRIARICVLSPSSQRKRGLTIESVCVSKAVAIAGPKPKRKVKQLIIIILDCCRDLKRLLGQEARCQICANFYSDVTALRAHCIDHRKTNNSGVRWGLSLAHRNRAWALFGAHRNRVWALLGAHRNINTLDDNVRNFAGLVFVLRPENAWRH